MLEKILALDTQLFVYLNGLGSETYDGLWLLITKQFNWIPFFVLLLYVLFKKIGLKQSLYLLVFIAVLITLTDQTTNLFKFGFQRLRPCNSPDIKDSIRIVKSSATFSFFSGHAANTMAVATILFLNFRKRIPYLGFLFLWPLIFAYSRIYLGLHYPLDILCGYLCGFTLGFVMYKVYLKVQQRYFPL